MSTTQLGRVRPATLCAAVSLFIILTNIAEGAEPAARWSWQEPQAKVLPTGDLRMGAAAV